jgi:2-polyprenyl-3-methyl-5-hydroxy-6-metoxy-1,4-benzoquinol methylase
MKCKYKAEQKLLYTYEDDIHSLERNIKAFNTGKCVSPSLDWEHYLFILEEMRINLKGKKILNIGCGHGILDLLIAKNYNCKITSVEFSKKRVERCNLLKKKFNIKNVQFIHEDVNIYLDKLDRGFDIVMGFEVIEHLHNQKTVIDKCKHYSSEAFFGSVPIQPNYQQKQHISPFNSVEHAKEVLKSIVYPQSIIPLRLPECVFFYY